MTEETNKMTRMEVENEKMPEETAEHQTAEATEQPSEIGAALWSVVSFDRREAQNLTYPQAEEKIRELIAQKISGLCIVTDEAAERLSAGK